MPTLLDKLSANDMIRVASDIKVWVPFKPVPSKYTDYYSMLSPRDYLATRGISPDLVNQHKPDPDILPVIRIEFLRGQWKGDDIELKILEDRLYPGIRVYFGMEFEFPQHYSFEICTIKSTDNWEQYPDIPDKLAHLYTTIARGSVNNSVAGEYIERFDWNSVLSKD